MKKVISLLAVFLVAVMWSAAGFSADKYVSGAVGISWMNDAELEDIAGLTDATSLDAELDFSSGITLLGALGCDYGDYRVEGELGYQRNDVDALNLVLPSEWDWVNFKNDLYITADLDGDITVLSLLMNGYYDIALGGGVELSPTVGVGVAQVSMGDVSVNGVSCNDCPDGDGVGAIPLEEWVEDLDLNIHEVTFAYQAGVGLGIPLTNNIMLDARYRYFGTTDFTMLGVNTNITSHNGLLGLRVMF
ncbi:MAG: outer membrane beta-barrel protein [Chlorobiales bacterium]|nr:outer membrane beta-barrel protein [Chlorobiales bacterium]